MTKDRQPGKYYFLTFMMVGIVLIGTCLFSVYVLRQRKIFDLQKQELKAANAGLRQELEIIKYRRTEAAENLMAFGGIAQIYNLVTENANQQQIRIKGFMPAQDTDDLLITLIGTYPGAIYFFEGLNQHQFGNLKRIEFKKYDREPKVSVEIQVTLNASSKGGIRK